MVWLRTRKQKYVWHSITDEDEKTGYLGSSRGEKQGRHHENLLSIDRRGRICEAHRENNDPEYDERLPR